VNDRAATAAALERLERTLDPSAPEASPGVRVLGYGEISVALTSTALPGLVVKRMSGFADEAAASRHATLVERYVHRLRDAELRVVDTDVVVVPRRDLPPTVAIVQPQLPAERLGHHLLHTVDDAGLASMVRRVLSAAHRALSFHAVDGATAAVDAQLSNWWFEEVAGMVTTEPVLVDVGTPFMRRGGRLLMDREPILAAAPRAVRPYFRWARTVETYQDDYFDLRTTAIDLLGNLHKEGCPHRLPTAIDVVNDWLAAPPNGSVGTTRPKPVTRAEVNRYYRSDAALLELYLRLRRADRFVQTRVWRRRYDFVVPGRVAR
jgi:hypothetical protein